MAASAKNMNVNGNSNSSRLSLAMERTGQWVFSQEIPTDIVVKVGEANFSLHKFMLVAKSGYIRNMVMESTEADLSRIDLSDIPGGPEIFEKAAKFCYGVNFEINVHNVAALRCAAEYLEMTDRYCEANLGSRTDDFLSRVALLSFSGALVVLKCCEHLLPLAEDLNMVQRCVDVVSAKACSEANFPSRSPTNWWTEELSILDVESFAKIILSMKSRGAKTHTLCSALITFTERGLRDLVRDHSGGGVGVGVGVLHNEDEESRQKSILESIVRLMPAEKAAFSVNFLCCLLRSAIFLKTATNCKNELEKRIAAILEHVTVDDLLVLSFSYDGERLFDLESVRRIISTFVEKEKSAAVFNEQVGSSSSPAMQRVAKTVDAYLGEIASYEDLSIAKFNGIAVLVPKAARNVDDDLYRAIDIYLKAHPGLDEIEREKVCSVMDALKLSYEARVHASQNKRLPVQIVLHALYYDQLKLRSGGDVVERTTPAHDHPAPPTKQNQQQLKTDLTLVRENEALRSELIKMKMYISHMQTTTTATKNNNNSNHIINDHQTHHHHHQGSSNRGGGGGGPAANRSRPSTFFSSVSKTLGKFNPFRHGSKDTSNIDDGAVDVNTKPRRRRFSIS
ncbi:hypothetical protein Scep_005921 [Stephania cephalantha]|uniref:Root phototropism protein 2 n=1 Tax=Stephania cephalantha TaxID=152367 RepID=A0AAP0KWZ0_9MAGN